MKLENAIYLNHLLDIVFTKNADQVPDPSEFNSTDINLIIFDDLILEKQYKCESYYVQDRYLILIAFI
jgi:hypothetical protein